MKKVLLLLLSLILVFAFVGCSGDVSDDMGATQPADEVESEDDLIDDTKADGNELEESSEDVAPTTVKTELEVIMTGMYDAVKATSEEQMFPKMMTTEVPEDRVDYFLGSADLEYQRALVSEPMMGSYAHSVVLTRVNEDTTPEEIEKMKKTIKENIDPVKWICVSVDAEKVIVEHVGDVIILIMDNEHGELMLEAFNNIAK